MTISLGLDIIEVSMLIGVGLRIGWDLPYSVIALLEGFIRGFKRGYNSGSKS